MVSWKLAVLLVSFQIFSETTRAQVVYLNSSSPANNSVYFSYPDVAFSLPPIGFLASGPNGTTNIVITTRETTLSWAGQSFSPNGAIDPPNFAQAITTWQYTSTSPVSRVGGFTNRTLVNYTVTESSTGALLYVSMPYRRVCFTAQVGTTSIVYCYRIYVRLAPMLVTNCVYTSTLLYANDQMTQDCPYKPLQLATTIGVGNTLEAWIYFQSMNRDGTVACTNCDTVQILLQSDPGLPNWANLGASTGGPSSGSTDAGTGNLNLMAKSGSPSNQGGQKIYFTNRKLSFTPRASQLLTFTIRVVAKATSKWPALQNSPLYSQVQTFKISVQPPDIRFDDSTDFGPQMVPVASPTLWPLRVGCTYSYKITLYEAKDFGALIDGFPSDPTTASSIVAGYKSATYVPVVSVLDSTPLPSGASLSPATRVQVCSNRGAWGTCALQANVPTYYTTVQTLTWKPPRGFENQTVKVCLKASDPVLEANAPGAGVRTLCTEWQIALCEVCTTQGDTLVSIAKAYRTDWLQLWGANPTISNPNSLALPTVLKLGPVYYNSPAPRSVALLSKLFGMDSAVFLQVNPFINSNNTVATGAGVCIMSTVCA